MHKLTQHPADVARYIANRIRSGKRTPALDRLADVALDLSRYLDERLSGDQEWIDGEAFAFADE